MPAFDPGRFRSSKHKFKKCRALRIKYLVKSVPYKFCTKFAKSVGLEKNGRRERILGLRCFVAVLRFMCEGPCLLGILRAYKATENFGRGRVGGGRGTGFQPSLAALRNVSRWFATDQVSCNRSDWIPSDCCHGYAMLERGAVAVT